MIIASIDIGTNTVLLLIAVVNKARNEIKTLKNFYSIPRIGKGLLPDNEIPEENIQRLLDSLRQYKEIITEFQCKKIIITGTKALRSAENSDDIIKRVRKELNFNIQIISGEEEAELSFLGSTSEGHTGIKNLVIDIGGGSTEIIYGHCNKIEFKKSFDVGVVSLTEEFLKHDPPLQSEILKLESIIKEKLNELQKIKFQADVAIAIAGTPTTLVCMKMNLKEYDEDKIEGSYLSSEEIKGLIEKLSPLSTNQIKSNYSSVVEGREDLILTGAIILLGIMELLVIKKVKVSSKGNRYGAIMKYIFKDSDISTDN